jgi:molybdenum cofactor cytidylyltransferase
MKFGLFGLAEAVGGVLAHSLSAAGKRISKGTVLTPEIARELAAAGHDRVMAAQLEPGDVPEDQAALRLASALAGPGLALGKPTHGRCNLYAEQAGLLALDPQVLGAINAIDEAITVATLAPWARVDAKQMVATIKIIPFAAAETSLNAAIQAAKPFNLNAFQPLRVALVQSRLPGQKAALFEKTADVTGRRVRSLGGTLSSQAPVPHETHAVAQALIAAQADLVLIVGASAIVDRGDVIPAAIVAAGGRIARLGMPVDPGNLLCLGELGGKPVIGLPGCARSPKLNGLDWVLERLFAGIKLTSADIAAMGVGGLLEEMPSRPMPRDDAAYGTKLGGLLLAAGRSSRMGDKHKLLEPLNGQPMVRWVAQAALNAGLAGLVCVLGHQAQAVRDALSDLPITFVENPDFPEGLSSSLKLGLQHAAADWAGVAVLLGDMPEVSSADIARLASAFSTAPDRIKVPCWDGKRGNPVLWPRAFWPKLMAVTGDTGGKSLLGESEDAVGPVEMGSDSVLLDIDTPDALAQLRLSRPR